MRDERDRRQGEGKILFSNRVLATVKQYLRKPDTQGPYTGNDLQGILNYLLQNKNISPRQNKYSGMPALLETCDRADARFFQEVEALQPDGYLIGIGCGGILSLLQCFAQETPPLGVIMIDINPFVIAGGKALVQEAKKAADPKSLLHAVYYYEQHYGRTLYEDAKEEDPLLSKHLGKWKGKAPQPKLSPSYYDSLPSLEMRDSKFISVPHIIYQQFGRIHELVTTERFALLYASFTNEEVIQAICSLPGFKQRRNIIYTSNAIDCHTGYSSDIKAFTTLQVYDNPDTPPIFVTASRKNKDELTLVRSFSQLRAMYS